MPQPGRGGGSVVEVPGMREDSEGSRQGGGVVSYYTNPLITKIGKYTLESRCILLSATRIKYVHSLSADGESYSEDFIVEKGEYSKDPVLIHDRMYQAFERLIKQVEARKGG